MKDGAVVFFLFIYFSLFVCQALDILVFFLCLSLCDSISVLVGLSIYAFIVFFYIYVREYTNIEFSYFQVRFEPLQVSCWTTDGLRSSL